MPKTKYGTELWRIRCIRNELLKNMADKIGYTSSYLSAIENGYKDIPEGLTDLIRIHYDLRDVELFFLQMAERITRMKIDNLKDLREALKYRNDFRRN